MHFRSRAIPQAAAARATALLGLLALAAPAAQAAPDVTGLRLLALTKDAARLRVTLSEPASVAVQYGQEPGDWTGRAQSAGSSDVHEIELTKLTPDRRYFYQLEVDGEPRPDVATFVSGRSWVTRRAVILATAAAPADTAEDLALADKLFAREADALVLLSGEGDEGAFGRLHARSMADRVVSTGPEAPAPQFTAADVLVGWPAGGDLAAAKQAAGACWSVGAGASGADVALVAGEKSALVREGDSLRVVLSAAARDHVVLDFASGTLTATLVTASGQSQETLSRTCPIPGATPAGAPTHDDFEDELGERSLDGEAHDAGCDGG